MGEVSWQAARRHLASAPQDSPLWLSLCSDGSFLSRSVPPRPCCEGLSPPAGLCPRSVFTQKQLLKPELWVLLEGPLYGFRLPLHLGLLDIPELLSLTPTQEPHILSKPQVNIRRGRPTQASSDTQIPCVPGTRGLVLLPADMDLVQHVERGLCHWPCMRMLPAFHK